MSTRSRKSIGPNGPSSRSSIGSSNRDSIGGTSTREIRETREPLVDNNESIKVICRFRPTREPKQRESSRETTGVERIDSFTLNSQNGEVQFVTDGTDGKTFKFDKV